MTTVLSFALVVAVHVSCLLRACAANASFVATDPLSLRRLVRVIPFDSIPVVSLSTLHRDYIPVRVNGARSTSDVPQAAGTLNNPISRLIEKAGLPVHLLRQSRGQIEPLVSERRVYQRRIPFTSPERVPYYGGHGVENRVFGHHRTGTLSPNIVLPQPIEHGAPPSGRGGGGHDGSWGYGERSGGAIGPSQWHRQFPTCNSRLQSPIDISGPSITFRSMPPVNLFTLDHSGSTNVIIRNTGVSVALKLLESNVLVTGGNLPGTFRVGNIHFHWGRSNSDGSEHHLLGKGYPGEMHIVTYNSKYRNLIDAAGRIDGVHVIAIFFELSRNSNPYLDFCFNSLRRLTQPGSEIEAGTFNITGIMPRPDTPFYRYFGSTTTPPCQQNVIWTAYATPQVISLGQLNQFRQLPLNKNLVPVGRSNIRPIQPLHNRPIYTNNPFFR